MASQGMSSHHIDSLLRYIGVTIFANGGLTNPSVAPSLDDARKAGQTVRENLMAKAIDFAQTQKSSAKWAHLDLTKIAAAGQSCGGMETLAMAGDKRVTTLGIFNSASQEEGDWVLNCFRPPMATEFQAAQTSPCPYGSFSVGRETWPTQR
jgi:hypothetical protein